MNLIVPDKELKVIEKAIASDQSVVGIDAKKTHIIIIHMLNQIQIKMDRLDLRMDNIEKKLTES